MSQEKKKQIADLKKKLSPVLEKLIGKVIDPLASYSLFHRPLNRSETGRPSGVHVTLPRKTNRESY